MADEDKSRSSTAQVWIAIIGLIGGLGGALIGNWEKIFPYKTVPPTPLSLASVPDSSGKTPPAKLLQAQDLDLASVRLGSEAKGPLSEGAEVETLVAAWEAAQNRGDFDSYRNFYAARMVGIKRVGAQVLEYDRDAWLADRARMFEHPMKVHTAGIEFRATEQSTVVRFDQSFAQGKFHDFGPKQLVLVREGGGLRIAREEMLQSVVLGRAQKVQ